MESAIIDTKLLTFEGDGLGIIDDGAVRFTERIEWVGKTADIDLEGVERVIDGSGHVTMPGLVNAHTHTGLTILRGGAQDVPEIEWMNKALAPLTRRMKMDDIIIGSKLGVLEGLRSGITTFGEYSSDVRVLIEEVYEPFGVRVAAAETINEVVSERTRLGPKDLYELDPDKGSALLKRTDELYESYKDSGSVDILYGPQALDMVSSETMLKVKEKAKERDCKIHMHVAQGERERLQVYGRYEKSTVDVLDGWDMLDSDLIAVHCHDTTKKERGLLVKSDVGMVGCPSSIAMIDGMVPPVWDHLSSGGSVGLGTDQAPGPGTHNMFREMRTISVLTKTMYKDPTLLPAWETLRLGCKGGAEVLGMDDKIGSIKEGKLADMIMVDLSKTHQTPSVDIPFHNYVPNLAYSTHQADNVIIGGKIVLLDGEFVHIDEEEVVHEAQERATVLFNHAADDWRSADSYLVEMNRKGML